jgi:protoheme ferro-lyase
MANEVSPLQSIQDSIRLKIKAEFVGLIPDEMWSAMVGSVIAEFTSDQTSDVYGRKEHRSSPLKQMIRAEIEGLAKAKLKAELDTLAMGKWGSYGEQLASDAVKKMISEHFTTILAAVQTGFVEAAVMQAVNHLRNSMQRM